MASLDLFKIVANPTSDTSYTTSVTPDGSTVAVGQRKISTGGPDFPGEFFCLTVNGRNVTAKGSHIPGVANEHLAKFIAISSDGTKIAVSSNISYFKIFEYNPGSSSWNLIYDTNVVINPNDHINQFYCDSDLRYICGVAGSDLFFYKYNGTTWLSVTPLSNGPTVISISNIIVTEPIIGALYSNGLVNYVTFTDPSGLNVITDITKYHDGSTYLCTNLNINREGTHVSVSYVTSSTYFVDIFYLDGGSWTLQETIDMGSAGGFTGTISTIFGHELTTNNRPTRLGFSVYPPLNLPSLITERDVYGIYDYNLDNTEYQQTFFPLQKLTDKGISSPTLGTVLMSASDTFGLVAFPFGTEGNIPINLLYERNVTPQGYGFALFTVEPAISNRKHYYTSVSEEIAAPVVATGPNYLFLTVLGVFSVVLIVIIVAILVKFL